jgi:hypothetical protein
MRIERDPIVIRINPTGREVETVQIGDPAGSIDDPISFNARSEPPSL